MSTETFIQRWKEFAYAGTKQSAWEDTDISHISGFAPEHIKKYLGDPKRFFNNYRRFQFGSYISERVKVTEIDVRPKAEEASKMEARMIFKTTVEEDMLNSGAALHGAAAAYMMDMCSAMALLILPSMQENALQILFISQSINVVYHAPSPLGDKLRIICTTMSTGARAMSCRIEIWSDITRRLIASATHIQMIPSLPPSIANTKSKL